MNLYPYKVVLQVPGHEDPGPHTYYLVSNNSEVAALKARAIFRREHMYKGGVEILLVEEESAPLREDRISVRANARLP